MIIRATTTTITELGRHVIASRRRALAVLSVAVTLAASAASAHIQVSVQGDRAFVHVEANNAPLSEVLSALEGAFSIRHRTSVPLDQSISGTYQGPLRYVMSRLLDGFNYYVADTAEGGMEITVVGTPGAVVVAKPEAKNPLPKLAVPPPTVEQVAAERERLHHRRPPPKTVR